MTEFKVGDKVTTDDSDKLLFGRTAIVTEILPGGRVAFEYPGSPSGGEYWAKNLRLVEG